MAAKTPDLVLENGVDSDAAGTTFGRAVKGLRHRELRFITANLDDGDTVTIAGDNVIVRAAWEAEGASDLVAVTVSANVATIASTGDNHTGILHLWTTY